MVELIPNEIWQCYAWLGTPVAIRPITVGIVNKTYRIDTERKPYILQEVSPIFDTTINEDSDKVCNHLEQKGLLVPKIYRARSGNLCEIIHNRVFRALTFIEGSSSHVVKDASMAHSAGAMLGRFHGALTDFQYNYRSKRHHAGDYPYHKSVLIRACTTHADHDYFSEASALAHAMLRDMDGITQGLVTTPRHVHGDPKISNLLFDDEDRAVALVDFDTLGDMGWSLEMADALRSWSNPYTEDDMRAHVDLSIAHATLQGYGTFMRTRITPHEAQELIAHSQAITLCLATRFLADSLNESYFGFDKLRFARSADHNLLRARAMYELFHDFRRVKPELSAMVHDLLL